MNVINMIPVKEISNNLIRNLDKIDLEWIVKATNECEKRELLGKLVSVISDPKFESINTFLQDRIIELASLLNKSLALVFKSIKF